jgi:hypothetical protein
MYGWRYVITRAVYHNGKFSHSMIREVVRHTKDKAMPRMIVSKDVSLANVPYLPELKGEEVTELENLRIVAAAETVSGIYFLGKAIEHTHYTYEIDE